MTTWLWIIGVAAFAWPVIIALYLDDVFTKHINLVATRSENSHLADLRSKKLREEITKLQNAVEEQDALIALLWYKEFGEIEPESLYDKADLARFFGRAPIWYLDAMEFPGAFDTLCRYKDYPWGKHAEWLSREEFRD